MAYLEDEKAIHRRTVAWEIPWTVIHIAKRIFYMQLSI